MKNNSAQVKKSTKPKKRKNYFLKNIQNIKLNNSGKLVLYLTIIVIIISFGSLILYQYLNTNQQNFPKNLQNGSLEFNLKKLDLSGVDFGSDDFQGYDFYDYGILSFGKYKDYKIVLGIDYNYNYGPDENNKEYNKIFLLTKDYKEFYIISAYGGLGSVKSISPYSIAQDERLNPDLYNLTGDKLSYLGLPNEIPLNSGVGVLLGEASMDRPTIKLYDSSFKDSKMKKVGDFSGLPLYFDGSAYYVLHKGIFFRYQYSLYGRFSVRSIQISPEDLKINKILDFEEYGFLQHRCNVRSGKQLYVTNIPKSELEELPNIGSLKVYTLKNYNLENLQKYIYPLLMVETSYFSIIPETGTYNLSSEDIFLITLNEILKSPDTFIFYEDEFGNIILLHQTETLRNSDGC